ncbi:MAG: hypothetical protein CMA48_00500 [Euryarchaeota archaeon]|nr:hypothetical protein [Euryarchaeota archaeon]|tara:strand:- start:2240 stop:3121 length:882 start_codon:yes stop_codon:yes gene_type:complete
MSEFINIPDYITKNQSIDNLNKILKIKILIKGKFLSLIINKTSGKFFSSLVNFFFSDKGKIYFENDLYIYKDKENKLFYTNKRVLRPTFGFEELVNELGEDYLLQFISILENDLIVDCGANIGEFYHSIRKKQKNINYIAFEPDPRTFRCLELNLKNQKGVQLFNSGLGSSNTELSFYISEDGSDSSFINPGVNEEIKVDSTTLDSYKFGKVKLIKIEAEGYEPEVLFGAKETIKNTTFITVDSGPERGVEGKTTLAKVIDFLYENGFKLIEFNPKRYVCLFINENQKEEYYS